MHKYQKLRCFESAKELTIKVYKLTSSFPSIEKFSLVSQLRRAAISIGSCIAEGSGRATNKEFAHFLSIAIRSTSEIEYQFIISRDLEYITGTEFAEISNDLIMLRKQLYKLRESLL